MELVIVALVLGAGAVFVLTQPARGPVVGESPRILTPQQIQDVAATLPPAPDTTPAGPSILGTAGAGASIGTSILPGAGTAIGAGIGALVGWIRSWFGPSEYERRQQSFAQFLGFADIDGVLRSLATIGRDDLVYSFPQVRPDDDFTLREYVEQKQALIPQFQLWMEQVIAAFQNAGYQFPA